MDSIFEYAEAWKWAMAVMLLFWLGIFGVSVSFLLIITSRDGESNLLVCLILLPPQNLLLLTLCFPYPFKFLVLCQLLT